MVTETAGGARPPTSPLSDDAVRVLAIANVLAAAVMRGGRLVEATERFTAMFGLTEWRGKAVGELAADVDRPRLVSALAAARGEPVAFDALRADGSVFEAELVARRGDVRGEPSTVLLATDVTARRRTERQLSYLAFLDPLTSLPNRALLLDRLRDTLAAARRDGRVFAVLMCDLDGFKRVNDTRGHDAGDALLQAVARRFEGTMRESDTLARIGGDEFAVLLARVARREDAAIVAERMVRALAAPIDVAGAPCTVGVSIGIATYPVDGADMDALMARADGAMYESKRAGKCRFTFAATAAGGAVHVPVPLVHWSDAHAVGIGVIDAQHRGVAELLAQLGDDLKAGRERDAVVATLRAIVEFTRKHFATEERLMARHPGWPMQAQHEQEHRKLLDDVASLSVALDERSMTLTMRFLQEWLVRHVETADKPLATWLRERGVE